MTLHTVADYDKQYEFGYAPYGCYRDTFDDDLAKFNSRHSGVKCSTNFPCICSSSNTINVFFLTAVCADLFT